MKACCPYWFITVLITCWLGIALASQVYVSLDNDGFSDSGVPQLHIANKYFPVHNTAKKFRSATQSISTSSGGEMVRLCSLTPVGYIKKAIRQGDPQRCGENSIVNGQMSCHGRSDFDETGNYHSKADKNAKIKTNEEANAVLGIHRSSLGKHDTDIQRNLRIGSGEERAHNGRLHNGGSPYNGGSMSVATEFTEGLNGKANYGLENYDRAHYGKHNFKRQDDQVNIDTRPELNEQAFYEESNTAVARQYPIKRAWSFFNPGIFHGYPGAGINGGANIGFGGGVGAGIGGGIGGGIGSNVGAGIGANIGAGIGGALATAVSGAGTNNYGGNGFYRYAVGRTGLDDEEINSLLPTNTDGGIYLPEDFSVYVDYNDHIYDFDELVQDNDFDNQQDHAELPTNRQRYSFGLG